MPERPSRSANKPTAKEVIISQEMMAFLLGPKKLNNVFLLIFLEKRQRCNELIKAKVCFDFIILSVPAVFSQLFSHNADMS
ncbi:hypothetical protein ACXO1E_04925 [Lactobacillus delbrueckii subsp. bulgaricus]